MTTKPTTQTVERAEGRKEERFRLPDPPERDPDEVTAFDQIYEHGFLRYLALHFGDLDTTLVTADRWMVARAEFNKARARRPDLVIAFGVSPEDYRASNGYIVSEQGKPPDFVMEVASPSTAEVDTGDKRDYYAGLGIPEYWRFDETVEHHGARLAGEILEGGDYQQVPIDEVVPGVVQGYSPVLNLIIRWDHGRLVWVDPATEAPILTYEDQEVRADQAETRANNAEARVTNAEARANDAEARVDQANARANDAEAKVDQANARANDAETRVNDAEARANQADARSRELKAELRRLRGEEH